MKKITFLFILLTVTLGYSQILIQDFETTLPTAIAYDTGGDIGDGTAFGTFLQVPNPDAGTDSGNESATVVEMVTGAAAQPWQNGQLFAEGAWSLDLTDANATGNAIVSVDIWSNTPTFILAKVVDGPGGAGTESATDASHGGSGWETLTFDFDVNKDNSQPANDVYTRILFFPIWNGGGYDGAYRASPISTTYYDNIIKEGPAASAKDFKIAGLSMYPNPTQDTWNIKTQNVEMTSISVYDVLGKSVLSMTPKATEVRIEARTLRTGLYFAKIETANGSQTVKLIKK